MPNEDVEKSARPSTRPGKELDAPAMVMKKTAKTEKIISKLTFVRKLTRPSLSTSGWTRELLFMDVQVA